jgi:hypothetical protein
MQLRRLPTIAFLLGVLVTSSACKSVAYVPASVAGSVPASVPGSVPASVRADARLPDLGMAPLRNFGIEMTVDGQSRLRFTTVIINIGDGPLQVWGHTPQTGGDLLVDQEIANPDATWTTVPTDFRMYFAGDGHNHWHLRDLETYELQNSAATLQRTSDKHGFCFFDDIGFNLALPGAPESAIHAKTDCGKASDTSLRVGLSIGWSDRYASNLLDQFIDITGLPPGEYTLTATVDAQGFLSERCEGNNTTTAILRIDGRIVSVVDKGKPSTACAR